MGYPFGIKNTSQPFKLTPIPLREVQVSGAVSGLHVITTNPALYWHERNAYLFGLKFEKNRMKHKNITFIHMKYEQRIIAYIDILGFSEMIKHTDREDHPDTSQQQLDDLLTVISTIKNHMNTAATKRVLQGSCCITMFSDTVVLSLPKAQSAKVIAMFEVLKKLQITMLSKGILMRGSVVHGKLIHNNDLIIGPELVNAYSVESKSAVYPRIVIDPKVTYLYLRKNGKPLQKRRIKDEPNSFTEDFDGTFYIDYFTQLDDFLKEKNYDEYMMQMKTLIDNGLKSKDASIRMKYLWMRKKMKEALQLTQDMKLDMEYEKSRGR